MKLKPVVTAVVLYVAFCAPMGAQQADPSGPQAQALLLERLGNTMSQADAGRLDKQLQALWSKSGSAAMDLLLKRGRDAMEVGETRTAIEHLTALTDHAPDFAEGWHLRASAFFVAGLHGPAIADLERALALNPNNYNAIFGLAVMLESFGDDKRAYEAYRQVRKLYPRREGVADAIARLEPLIQGQTL